MAEHQFPSPRVQSVEHVDDAFHESRRVWIVLPKKVRHRAPQGVGDDLKPLELRRDAAFLHAGEGLLADTDSLRQFLLRQTQPFPFAVNIPAHQPGKQVGIVCHSEASRYAFRVYFQETPPSKQVLKGIFY